VQVDDRDLRLSNYRREVLVPLASVVAVRENRWLNIRPITIEFREPTPFGQRVVFMPAGRGQPFWKVHPVAEELRQLVNQAGGTTMSRAAV
jgi:hypothetical protein